VLYKNGGASYPLVLASETNYFSSELDRVQPQLNERLALVQLYRAPEAGSRIANGARLAQLVVAFEFLDSVRIGRQGTDSGTLQLRASAHSPDHCRVTGITTPPPRAPDSIPSADDAADRSSNTAGA
jgi:hypothetical protein